MPNWKLIAKILGILLFIEAGLLATCLCVSLFYEESIMTFFWPMCLALVLGLTGLTIGRKAGKNMSRKDGYIIVSLVWIIFTLVGMFPFTIDGCIPDIAGAFFETMSGFTSTGSTVINDIDSVSKGVLFWRSMSQWIGGIGIIFFTIAILPAFGVGEVKLFAAESTGPIHDKVHPRISVAAKWIGTVYLLLTVLCIASLLLCGMNVFDAVNISFTTTATGGFCTHSALLHEVYNSPLIEYVLTFFMFISGVNYTLIYYTILKGRIKRFFMDMELKCYIIIVAVAVGICTTALYFSDNSTTLELAFRESAFTVISLQTTTGLATCDYTTWPVQLMPILLFVMFAGACSGSTSGGFKCIRITILQRILRNEFTRILHPRAVLPVRINNSPIQTSVIQTLIAFVALFIGALFIGAFVLAFFGVNPESSRSSFDYYEAFGIAMSSLSNVGPGMGYYGPVNSWDVLSPVAKVICSFLMLIGRLEIFPIILLFTRGFWKKA
ncbi:MAG: TrkH family potassium uptake protein [Bacteroidaceae bacterium]|nr:TrkH family potassium uptake protein [Bacteroidaceae bacterium]